MNTGKFNSTFFVCFIAAFAGVMNATSHSWAESKQVSQPIRLMSAAKDARLRKQIPKVGDEATQNILDDPSLILYTDAEIPAAYQDWSSGLPGVHSPSYNVSANGSERFGNANVEFPWGVTGGTHRSPNVDTFRFLLLPHDEQGKQRPIVWYRKFLRGSSSQGYAWTFPVGTVVGEVLQLRSPGSKYYTFEIRTRTREYGEWAVDVFRPFPTTGQLADRIKSLRPNWQQNDKLTKLVKHLETPAKLPRKTLADTNHTRVVFRETMGVDSLPPVGDDKLVAQLLTTTVFQSALGTHWTTASDKKTHTAAPTTEANFHVVPARYDGGFIEADRISCMRCHETANQHANDFDFGRDWYGRVRGSDGIFSIHPFDRGSVSYNGYGSGARMNDMLVGAGIFAEFQRDKHAGKIYQRLNDVAE